MNLEDQCVSLELAKRLKELGVKQNSLFYWYYALHDGANIEWKVMFGAFGLMPDRYSAFTVSELGKMLPASIAGKSASLSDRPIICQKTYDGGFSIYGQIENGSRYPIFNEIREADARASMLVYLIEQGLLNVADLSKHT